jgi:hypothetical protein
VVDARTLAVHAGHEADARKPELVAPRPHLLGLDLDLAPGRAEDEHGAGRGAEAVPRVVQEGGVAGRVDQVQVVLAPGRVMERAGDGALPPLLLGLGVERGRAVVDAAEPRARAGGEEQRVGDRGLPRPALPDHRDIPQLGDLVRRHRILRCVRK